jgi:predicted metal-dependent phosphotriesterase family hydrolase
MSIVRTVTGDIAPNEMGVTYSHEHIIIEESFPVLANTQFLLNDTEKVIKEVNEFYALGGRTLVDTMPANCGRNVLKLAEVAKATGANIIVPTGLHLEMYYLPNHWRFHVNADELTELFIQDITVGVDALDYGGPIVKRTPHKAGLIKLATGDEPISAHQEKIFEAVVNAHLATGAPILTHTNFGRHAIAQAELFDKLGANLKHVVLSHVDRCKDIGYHKELMQTGVCVEYDSFFRWKEGEENNSYKLLEQLLPEYPDKIVVGMDMAKNTYWSSYGGKPGLKYLLTEFDEQLTNRNLKPYWDNLFLKNPQKLYAFEK